MISTGIVLFQYLKLIFYIKVFIEVNGASELQSHEMVCIADKIISKVLVEYFNGDVKMMRESRSWGGLVGSGNAYNSNDLNIIDPQALPLTVKSGQAAKNILMKYIKLGKGKIKSIKGNKVRVAPIEALSLTGLTFCGNAYNSNDLNIIDPQALPLPTTNSGSTVRLPILEKFSHRNQKIVQMMKFMNM